MMTSQWKSTVPMSSRARLLVLLFAILCLTPSATHAGRLDSASQAVRRAMTTKVTLTFKEIAVAEALKVLSEESGVNMAISSGVRGTITVYLTDVDVSTALDIVTEMTGNAYIAEDDVIRIVTEEEYLRDTGNAFPMRKVLKTYPLTHVSANTTLQTVTRLNILTGTGSLLPDPEHNALVLWDVPESHARLQKLVREIDQESQLETIVVPLQYAATDALLQKLTPHLSEGIGSAEALGVGDSIAITDLSSHLPVLEDLVASFDAAPRQVLIEVKIIQVTHSDDSSVGINWQVVQEKMTSWSLKSAYSVLPGATTGTVGTGTVVSIGNLEDDDFNVVVDALESFGETDIVSLPRILAMDGEEASIHVGSSEPYVTVTTRESQGIITYQESVQMVAVGVKLNITPTIHPNDFISMAVRPEVSSVSRFETTQSGSTIPVVEQSTMQTSVQVKSGVYLILGGLMKKDYRESVSGVPVLRSLPILKYVFGNRTLQETRSELVVMIRPRIVTGDQPIQEASESSPAASASGR